MSLKHQIPIEIPTNIHIERPKFQKMVFIVNALEQGWTIKKKEDAYVFYKKHEGKKEIFKDNYLEKFIGTNNDIQNILDLHT
jgi:hypothetical protein